MQTVRILVADRHSLFRQALRELLDEETDFEVVAEAGDESETIARATQTKPDLALVSTELGAGDSITAIELINEHVIGCRAVIIAGSDDPEVLLRAVEAGASGYITKGNALSDLMSAARAIHRGETIVPPSMLGGLIQRLLRRRRDEDEAIARIARLTRRERQVLALLAEGGNKETIGRALFISPETARTHIQHVMAKLGVHSQLEAAKVAHRGNPPTASYDAFGVSMPLEAAPPGRSPEGAATGSGSPAGIGGERGRDV
jgi:two-component system, NarL family, response regulator DevR